MERNIKFLSSFPYTYIFEVNKQTCSDLHPHFIAELGYNNTKRTECFVSL
jgi:hypothetical protein